MKFFGIITNSDFDIDLLKKSFLLQIENDNITMLYDDHLPNVFLYYSNFELEVIQSTENALKIADINGLIFNLSVEQNQAYLFTDAFSLNKLFYYKNKDFIIFSSEIKSIIYYLKILMIELTPDEDFIFDMILFNIPTSDRTLYKEISLLEVRKKLAINIQNNSIVIVKNQDYCIEFRGFKDSKIILEHFSEVLTKDKRSETILYLSGGLDSRLILYLYYYKNNCLPDNIIHYSYEKTLQRKCFDNAIAPFDTIETKLNVHEIVQSMIVDNYLKYCWLTEGMSSHLNSNIYHAIKNYNERKNLIIYDGLAGDAILGGNHYKKIANLHYMIDNTSTTYYNIPATKITELTTINNSLVDIEMDFYHNNHVRKRAAAGSMTINKNYGIVCYPFMRKPFYELVVCHTIEERKDHKLYKKILSETYPEILREKSTSLELRKLNYKIHLIIAKKLKLSSKRFLNYVDPDSWFKSKESYYQLLENSVNDLNSNSFYLKYFNEKNIKKEFSKISENNKANKTNTIRKYFDLINLFKMFYDLEGFNFD
ncbi:MAG: hypothetical protein JXA54_05525 [Candidatus Heimdallarchaeota archaeon]|nr:hypothetical protein [Candidatus Heimdallarchaeota archaeon]